MATGDQFKSLVKRVLPSSARDAIRRRRRSALLSSTTPASRCFGVDRGGQAIDRHYIERFLATHRADVQGRVLEIGDRNYTTRFGGNRVQQSDVLHVDPQASEATIIGDLASGKGIPCQAFDCFICTQTLMFIYDVRGAISNMHRLLRPGGVVLTTMSGISQVCRFDMDRWGDFWRFTSQAAARLFAEAFGDENVTVEVFGNSFTSVALLQGLTTEELTSAELDATDRDYEVIIGVRAQRADIAGAVS